MSRLNPPHPQIWGVIFRVSRHVENSTKVFLKATKIVEKLSRINSQLKKGWGAESSTSLG